MLVEMIWPTNQNLHINQIEMVDQTLFVEACGCHESEICPDCGIQSTRKNGKYKRYPRDLPCSGYAVHLHLIVPRFFCDNQSCSRRTFSAQFQNFVKVYARRTDRLQQQQKEFGFAISAEGGSRLLEKLSMATSPDTLLRLVRKEPERSIETPRVLGIDDWAIRKGQTYGTILVDLEKQVVVDLLPDREVETVIAWLQKHPKVEIISRDRGSNYIEGATKGAPQAIQVADRFHLISNMIDALIKVLKKNASQIRKTAQELAKTENETQNNPKKVKLIESNQQRNSQKTIAEHLFDEVKALQNKGWSRRAIASRLDIDRRTVSRYFDHDVYPKKVLPKQSISCVLPYKKYLLHRWEEGCQSIKQLHQELTEFGFVGSYEAVRRFITRRLEEGHLNKNKLPKNTKIPNVSPTQIGWHLILPNDRLKEEDIAFCEELCRSCPKINRIAQLTVAFITMIRDRNHDLFDTWLTEMETCGVKTFVNFSAGLRRDYEAVKSSMKYEWSNGQVEGQVNRLKFIKRIGYGRANFDLLRKRVLGSVT